MLAGFWSYFCVFVRFVLGIVNMVVFFRSGTVGRLFSPIFRVAGLSLVAF